MQKTTKIAIYCLFLSLVVLAIFEYQKALKPSQNGVLTNEVDFCQNENITLKIKENTFCTKIAKNQKEREKGLSNIKNIAENNAMFFVFEEKGLYGFWMREMNFDIDILWIDENYKIIDITKEVKSSSFPQTFYPKEKVKFVVEIKSGISEKNGIKIGDFISLKKYLQK